MGNIIDICIDVSFTKLSFTIVYLCISVVLFLNYFIF